MKVRASVRRMCDKCKIVRRRGVVFVVCADPRHKQRQGWVCNRRYPPLLGPRQSRFPSLVDGVFGRSAWGVVRVPSASAGICCRRGCVCFLSVF